MLDQRTIFEIHRLAHAGLSIRKIAKTLGLSRQTPSKYLDDPTPPRPRRPRPSQLEPFKDTITRLLELNPKVSAVVLRQRLQEQGFTGGITIVRQYLISVRPASQQKRPFIRFESATRCPMPDRLGPLRRHGLWRHPAQTLLPRGD